jgi:DNA-binding NtrC family response regulator
MLHVFLLCNSASGSASNCKTSSGGDVTTRVSSGVAQESARAEVQQQPKPTVAAESMPGGNDTNEEPIVSLRAVRAQGEIQAILSALKRTRWNRKQAARLLNISYRGLLYKIRRHNITAA